jgi:hypothetical protein
MRDADRTVEALMTHGQRRWLLCFAGIGGGSVSGRYRCLTRDRNSIWHLQSAKWPLSPFRRNARDLKLTLETFGEEMKDVKATITGLIQNPLDVAAQRLLIPAALSIVKGLRSRKSAILK